jgi:hypothetical protein
VQTLSARKLAGMTNDSRLDLRVPARQREGLKQLAKDTGLTVPGLVRLATQRLLDDRASLLRGSSGQRQHVEGASA